MNKTLEGLLKAFIGESQARNRYTFYAGIARKEGYEQIGEIFDMTAENEREHAHWFYKMIKEVAESLNEDLTNLMTDTSVPFMHSTTEANLIAAIAGETHEYTTMYPEISDQALKDGFTRVAARVKSISVAEKHHAERYAKLLSNLKANTVFVKEEAVWWYCRECGYMHFGVKPPEECPACGHPKAFYQVLSEEY